jgi:glycosyltransferase involved in cell wall biosynthesis
MNNGDLISVNISGYLQAELGVGEVGRILARGADHAGIEYSTLTSNRTLNRQNFGFEERTLVNSSMINLIAINADQMKIWAQDVGPEVVEGRYNIGVWSWELEDFPEIFDEAFNFVDEVWANSEFAKKAIKKRTNKPVFAVPFHVETVDPAGVDKLDRGPLSILPSDHYFLFMFDFLSDIDRKNPLGLIDSFKMAFAPNSGPKLVIKTINGSVKSEDLNAVLRAVVDRPDIVVYDGYLDKSQRTALIAECLAYMSLHRSEGYGLTMAEAMSHGKPVIATAYSANCEFMSSNDSLLIPFQLISTLGNPTYPYDSHWADPDKGAAAAAMRRVFIDEDFAQQLGHRARTAQQTCSSVQQTSEFMLDRLVEVQMALTQGKNSDLAVPKGHLSMIIDRLDPKQESSGNEIAIPIAPSLHRFDLRKIKSLRYLVRLARKIVRRLKNRID